MGNKIKSAKAGVSHTPIQAPQWDYDNNQKLSISASSTQSAAFECQLVQIISTVDAYITIGANPTATSGQGSRPIPAMIPMVETIETGSKIAVIQKDETGDLYITPAAEEEA